MTDSTFIVLALKSWSVLRWCMMVAVVLIYIYKIPQYKKKNNSVFLWNIKCKSYMTPCIAFISWADLYRIPSFYTFTLSIPVVSVLQMRGLGYRLSERFSILALHPYSMHHHFLSSVHLKSPVFQILNLLQSSISEQLMDLIYKTAS